MNLYAQFKWLPPADRRNFDMDRMRSDEEPYLAIHCEDETEWPFSEAVEIRKRLLGSLSYSGWDTTEKAPPASVIKSLSVFDLDVKGKG